MHDITSLWQDSASSPALIDLTPEPASLSQPAVITATLQPASSTSRESQRQPPEQSSFGKCTLLEHQILREATRAWRVIVNEKIVESRLPLITQPPSEVGSLLTALQKGRKSLTCSPRQEEARWLSRGRGELQPSRAFLQQNPIVKFLANLPGAYFLLLFPVTTSRQRQVRRPGSCGGPRRSS